MKKVLVVLICLTSFQVAFADVWVNGYTKKDGTVVAPHYRSNPDGIKSNNYSERNNSWRSSQKSYNRNNNSYNNNKSNTYNSNPYLDEVYGR